MAEPESHWRGAPSASIVIGAGRDDVFARVSDPTTYPDWLPAARRIRSVDATWPTRGSSFRHVVGVGPVRIADSTEVLGIDAPGSLELRARIGVLGAADVRFTLTEIEEDDGGVATRVDVEEKPEEGPLAALWKTLARVNIGLGLWGRNQLALRRLKQSCEADPTGRPAPGGGAAPAPEPSGARLPPG